jgi:glycosyltransferase involved in cell wall biosynthesis
MSLSIDISVVIPLYNKKATIARALESVKCQTVQPREIIVVDDGSTDGSSEVVELLGIRGLRLIHQENAGVSAARNKGVREAVSEWIAFLDADDEWMAEYLEELSILYDEFPHSGVLATAYYFGTHRGEIQPLELNGLTFKRVGIMTNYFEVAARSAPPLWSSAVCVRKSALMKIGCFPEGVRSGEDLLTWARLAAHYDIAYSMNPLAVFWQDAAHVYDAKPNRIPDMGDPVGKGLRELASQESKSNGIRFYLAHWHKMRASIYLRLGLRRLSVLECLKSLSYNTINPKIYGYLMLNFLPFPVVERAFRKLGSCP